MHLCVLQECRYDQPYSCFFLKMILFLHIKAHVLSAKLHFVRLFVRL